MSDNYNYAEIKQEGLELVQDGSKQGVDAFVTFIQEDYSQLSADDKNKIYNKMYNTGREADNGITLRGEDNNGNGYLDVTEIWTESDKTPYKPIPKASARRSSDEGCSNPNYGTSVLGDAVSNVQGRNQAVDGLFGDLRRTLGY